MHDHAYINGTGSFLPGAPVENAGIVDHIGAIDDQSPRIGRLILRQNRIKARYYALDTNAQPTHSCAEMGAHAALRAIDNSEATYADLDFLGAATTQGDLLVPGHGSAVHAELAHLQPAIGSLEIASFQSVCASAMMAARNAIANVRLGEARTAIACAAEFPSRWFRKVCYEQAKPALEDREVRMAAEFLRWTLSDGAGAALFSPAPNNRHPSLRVDWSSLHSLADRFDVCMLAGTAMAHRHELKEAWGNYDAGPAEAVADGAVILLQDMVLLKRIIAAWIGVYLSHVDSGRIEPKKVDWLLCHYSAHSLREEIIGLLKGSGAMIDEERWFTNLYDKGNTGSASIFVMLDEFMQKGLAKSGDRILCIVPESGRAMVSFMHLTAM